MMSLAASTRCSKTRVLTSSHSMNLILPWCNASTSTASCPRDGILKEANFVQPYESIPGPRGLYNLPFIGILFHFKPFGNYNMSNYNHLIDDMIEQYGPIFKIRFTKPAVVITDPKDLITVVRNEGKHPYRPNVELLETYYNRTNTTPTFETLQGDEWQAMRTPIQKVLMKPKEVSKYLPMMNAAADDFIQMLSEGHLEKYDAEDAFMSFIAESVGTAVFNTRLGFLDKIQTGEAKQLKDAIGAVFDLMIKTFIGKSFTFKYFRSKDYVEFETALNYLRTRTDNFIKLAQEDMKKREKSGTYDPDEPSMILSLLKENSPERTALMLNTAFIAAIDSSKSTLQMVLYTLAKYQDKQQKLREEIYNVVGDDKVVTQDHLNKMHYMKACLKEVYRHWSIAVFGTIRVLPVDVVLSGYTVPAGVQIYSYNAKAGRDESIFTNPQNFEPERWLRQPEGHGAGSALEGDSLWAIHPFGVGVRSCPGRRIFEQELYLAAIKLVQKLNIGLKAESMDAKFEYRPFVRPIKPIKFSITPVSKW